MSSPSQLLYYFGQFQYLYGNATDYLYHLRVLSTTNDLSTSAQLGQEAQACWTLLRIQTRLRLWHTSNYNITLEQITALYNYSGPAESLYYFQVLSNDLRTSAQWGKFASDILTGRWHNSSEEFSHSRTSAFLDPTSLNPLSASSTPGPRHDTFLAPTYLNTIQTSLNAIREVTKAIQTKEYQYSDTVTNFLKALYMDFDFEEAQKELGGAADTGTRFWTMRGISSVRHIAGSWIVNLIRETRMGADAKIDLEKNFISISCPPLPVYQSVIKKTRQLGVRTQALGVAIARTGVQPSTQHEQPAAQKDSPKDVGTVGA
ncbi:hypothetical protein CVT24_007506 [Panaeolus cyanescens]|uniref:PCI domain-containing protein n=1 Tax=Panaeolus cyanescens TaxID=181874 RepID=A0A409YMG2_9AGAR|nr:hypothetical protein CVT24_007506 [Panaeolus cyanescens]